MFVMDWNKIAFITGYKTVKCVLQYCLCLGSHPETYQLP
uniref:Uncharacterized protein n=1 Tax=Anguilla anguilla TaxID=7936 RepID=A0A0E9VPU8_ANGAN